ncbi:MAG: polymer-forming cytoskeletal protein [bacterium]|nr:polymer-forming cytoskeletal protein [bacterium]
MDGESRFRKIKLSSNGKAINTVIGRGSVSEGRFRIETGVRVDGVLKGELVSSGTLIVGESGVIEADVRVREALVSGRIVGDLIAEEKVHLQSQATFIGKIKTRMLIVEEGATFKAECDAGGEVQVTESGQHSDIEEVTVEEQAQNLS